MFGRRFNFGDINLIPRKCVVSSRSECLTHIKFGKFSFKMPVVPANMECVIDDSVAQKLASNGYFYIHNRFTNRITNFVAKMKASRLPASISIGVNQDAYSLIDYLIDNNLVPDYITIDIAHGHSLKMQKIIKYIYDNFSGDSRPFIIAGNVSTGEGVKDLEKWGADAIKIGIGPGMACTTYMMTGFGSRGIQASTIEECAQARQNNSTLIIADGGIKEPGDIAKSLVLGADMCMIGGLLSGLADSPGNTVVVNNKNYKEFWGSASEFQSGKSERIEGTKILIPTKSHGILDEMEYLRECLQSAISYGGGTNLSCFKGVKYLS